MPRTVFRIHKYVLESIILLPVLANTCKTPVNNTFIKIIFNNWLISSYVGVPSVNYSKLLIVLSIRPGSDIA